MHKAVDVAKWFINNAIFYANTQDTEYMSPLKLQKLLYFAQGAYGAMYGKRLFEEEIVHWQHGPVVKEVYEEYRSFDSKGIDEAQEYETKFDNRTISFLNVLYDVFGKFSAWGLVEMTHEHRVWKETKNNEIMDFEKIVEYFKAEEIVIE